jgi:hypothetical protein
VIDFFNILNMFFPFDYLLIIMQLNTDDLRL